MLADFGLSNIESETKPGWGCVPFMSPECLQKTVKHLSHKTDLYSFGVMMEKLLNHERGKERERFWPMFKDPQTVLIDEMYKGLGLNKLLKRCLEPRASDRGDFSGFSGAGMLWDVLKWRKKRSAKLDKGELIPSSYWAANN